MIHNILDAAHNNKTAGHFGVEKTIEKAQELAWWPTLKDDIKAWVQGCDVCQRFKISTISMAAPIKPILP